MRRACGVGTRAIAMTASSLAMPRALTRRMHSFCFGRAFPRNTLGKPNDDFPFVMRATPRRHPSPYLFTAHPIHLFGLAWLVTMSMNIHAFGTARLGIRMGTAVARSLQLQAFAQGSIRHRHQVKSAHTFTRKMCTNMNIDTHEACCADLCSPGNIACRGGAGIC